jgi:hypothetical protein
MLVCPGPPRIGGPPRTPARFLVLGSAAPELLRQSAESLAGRIAFRELPGLTIERHSRHWHDPAFQVLARVREEKGMTLQATVGLC